MRPHPAFIYIPTSVVDVIEPSTGLANYIFVASVRGVLVDAFFGGFVAGVVFGVEAFVDVYAFSVVAVGGWEEGNFSEIFF